MKDRIDQEIRWLDAKRSELLDELESLSPEALALRPETGKWSILEIVEHLVVAERDVFEGFPAVADLVDRRRRLKNRVTYLLVFFILRFGVPVRTPSPKMVPQGGRALAELRLQWDENIRRLFTYSATPDREGLRRVVFQHPAAGPITLVQALTLDRMHLRNHARQIRRLLLR